MPMASLFLPQHCLYDPEQLPCLKLGICSLPSESPLSAPHREAGAQVRDEAGTAEPHRGSVSIAQSHTAHLPGGRIRANLRPNLVPAHFSRLQVLLLPESPEPPFPHPTHRTLLRSLAHTGRGYCPVPFSAFGPKAPLIPCLLYGCPSQYSPMTDGLSLRLLTSCSLVSLSASGLGAQTSNLLLPE